MKLRHVLLLLFLPFAFFILFQPAVSSSDYLLRGFEKADLVKVLAYCRDKIITVNPIYINKAQDRGVMWDRNFVSCSWTVYSYNYPKRARGNHILLGTQTLTRSDQSFYIDLRNASLYAVDWIELECVFTLRSDRITVTNAMSLR